MTQAAKPTAFGPFKERTFAILWSAALIANIGTWFRDVANGWAMTEMAPSPVMVSMVQAAAMLPVFLLSLPAGALADSVDRRKMLLWVQALLISVSIGLASLATAGAMTPSLLLALTLAGGIGAALMGPPWQSITPEIVSKPLLRPAIALNSLGVNIARAIGPALGGLMIASFGLAVAYWLDAASYLFVISALLLWRRKAAAPHLAPERFMPAMATGVGYVWRSVDVKRTLLRAASFFLFASAYWALLPLIARQELGGDAGLYGALLAAIGAGAVTGALLLPRLPWSGTTLVLIGTLITAAAMAVLALVPNAIAAGAALFAAGAAWIAVLTTLNVTAQSVLPNWVRARGLAVYITVFFGAMTAGSAGWGLAAQQWGIGPALLAAAACCGLVGLLASAVPLPNGEADLTPSMHWPEPATVGDIPGERGPIMVQIVYRVAAENRTAFLEAVATLSHQRLRDGGFGWRVFEDAEDVERYTEIFFAPSWLDHLRQHERVTKADQALQEAVNRFHQGPAPPAVSHHLAAAPGDQPGQSLAHHHRDIP
jgi:MFS family permease